MKDGTILQAIVDKTIPVTEQIPMMLYMLKLIFELAIHFCMKVWTLFHPLPGS